METNELLRARAHSLWEWFHDNVKIVFLDAILGPVMLSNTEKW